MKIRRNYGTVAFALAGSVLFLANTTAATADDPKNPLVLETYKSFFIGGERSDIDGDGNYRLDGHAYVEAFIPQRKPGKKRHPIVMMHSSISATIFLGAANGTEGAAIIFARAGHPVYVVDPPGTGRAPRDTALLVDGDDVPLPVNVAIGQSNSSTWESWQNGPAFGQLGNLGPFPFAPNTDEATLDPTPHQADGMNQMPCDADDFSTAIPCPNPDPEGVNQWIGHMNVTTTRVPGTPSIDDPVRDAAVKALLDHIGEPVIWMGWSRGGLLGQRLIVQQPESFVAWAAFEGCQTSTEAQPVNGYTPAEFDAFLEVMSTFEQPVNKHNRIAFLHLNPDYARDVGLSRSGGTSRGVGQYVPSGKRCVLGDPPTLAEPQNNVSKYINDNGGHAETIYAPDEGVSGNGHNPFLNNNIKEYAQIYLDWFKKNLN